jgi:hypothetical protein
VIASEGVPDWSTSSSKLSLQVSPRVTGVMPAVRRFLVKGVPRVPLRKIFLMTSR